MKVTSKTFRTNTCPYCHKENKVVFWAGDQNQVRLALNPNKVICKHCKKTYWAKDAVYFYDTMDSYVLSLSDSNKPDSRETLSIDEEVEFNVVDNRFDFMSTVASRVNDLNYKATIAMWISFPSAFFAEKTD